AEQELVVLEDNPYGLLRYEGEALPTLYSLDGGRYVIYAGTFSKILSAGLRIGWVAAPEEFLPRETTWTVPQGGLFIWAKLPDYIDTTDLLARALREHVAFVPGRAAYLDGRGGSEMRLNFSGVNEDEIREGIRRIGKIVAEQVALYGTLTGAKPAPKRGS